jgi:hypothetical protein
MFPGSPARLRPGVALRSLLSLAHPGAVLGVWVRGCRGPAAIRCRGPSGVRHLLAAEDLGYLLRRCGRIAVRDGEQITLVPSGVLLGWRVLEIVLAAPYLPAPGQLHALFPTARIREGVVALPLGLGSAEEALALCAAGQLPVTASRIGYLSRER